MWYPEAHNSFDMKTKFWSSGLRSHVYNIIRKFYQADVAGNIYNPRILKKGVGVPHKSSHVSYNLLEMLFLWSPKSILYRCYYVLKLLECEDLVLIPIDICWTNQECGWYTKKLIIWESFEAWYFLPWSFEAW